ncbi:FkbM family methyltransferase [Streptomyces sp. NPDC049887]|uniref:FkbM family methyltransferase n=1 Tax=unclassified Streptomyces TaxID=2593676 RepID=UPI0034169133
MQVHEAGLLGRTAKAAAPRLCRLASSRRIRQGTRLLEIYLEILQGRGAGTGWDLHGEIVAARRCLRGVEAPVIFDVGANYGQWSTGLHSALGTRNGRYFLFEPQPACRPALARTRVPNQVVIPAAVSDEEGSATIFADTPGSGVASVHRRRDSYFGDMTAHQEKVPVTTIDREVERWGVERIDLLKLDIEGAEYQALRGAAGSLRDRRVTTIAFEFGSANVYSRTFFRDFWDLLTPLGYRLWRICPGGVLLPVQAYTEELEHFRGVSNYLASLGTPESRTPRMPAHRKPAASAAGRAPSGHRGESAAHHATGAEE